MGRFYSTSFDANEDPISDGGLWINRGLDWTQPRASGGVAFGNQPANDGAFNDSYAQLTGSWSASQRVGGIIFKGSPSGIMEVELLLRVTSLAHWTTLYECNFAHDGAYANVYRWQGPLGTVVGDFIQLAGFTISGGPNNGDLLEAQIVGNVIQIFRTPAGGGTRAQVGTDVVDTAGAGGGAFLTSGAPGMGFFRSGGAAESNFGFTSYFAQDLSTAGAGVGAGAKEVVGPMMRGASRLCAG